MERLADRLQRTLDVLYAEATDAPFEHFNVQFHASALQRTGLRLEFDCAAGCIRHLALNDLGEFTTPLHADPRVVGAEDDQPGALAIAKAGNVHDRGRT